MIFTAARAVDENRMSDVSTIRAADMMCSIDDRTFMGMQTSPRPPAPFIHSDTLYISPQIRGNKGNIFVGSVHLVE
jgi:hypothetical protein